MIMETEAVSEILADSTGCCGCQLKILFQFFSAKASRSVPISLDVHLLLPFKYILIHGVCRQK
jgi:hypothetical protein